MIVTTQGKGWQKRCWELAQTGTDFQLLAVKNAHIIFIQELCAAYKCKYKYVAGDLIMTFPQLCN